MANISSGKCTTCHRKTEPGEKYLICGICKNGCHPLCENIADKTAGAIINLKELIIWICGPCQSKDPLNLLSLIPKLIESQQSMAEELRKLSDKVNQCVGSPVVQSSSSQHADVLQEIEEQRCREKNLVIFGLDTGTNPKDAFIKLCKEALGSDIGQSIERVTASKSSKLTFVSMKSVAEKEVVLHSASKLRKSTIEEYKKVFINQDLTRAQRSRFKELRAELKERPDRGEKVVIRGLKIVGDRDTRDQDHGPPIHSLNCFYSNVRSALPKRTDIIDSIIQYHTDVLILTESWLYPDISDNILGLQNFSIYRKDRESRGGGILIAIRNDLHSKKFSNTSKNEILAIDLLQTKTNIIRIICIYLPHGKLNLNTSFFNYLREVMDPRKKTIIIEDFNLPHANWDILDQAYNLISSFQELLMNSGPFHQIVKFPTRVDSFLDLIIVNKLSIIFDISDVPPIGSSDHSAIKFKIFWPLPTNFSKTVKYFSKANYEMIKSYLSNAT